MKNSPGIPHREGFGGISFVGYMQDYHCMLHDFPQFWVPWKTAFPSQPRGWMHHWWSMTCLRLPCLHYHHPGWNTAEKKLSFFFSPYVETLWPQTKSTLLFKSLRYHLHVNMSHVTASILNAKATYLRRALWPTPYYFKKNIHLIYCIFLTEICRGLLQVQQRKYILWGNQWLKQQLKYLAWNVQRTHP